MSRVIAARANGHGPAPGAAAIVTFRIGGQRYGLPISAVREVVQVPALTVLPGAAPALRGLLNRRGRYLPVLDGRALTGVPAGAADLSLDSHVILLGGAEAELGLLVDQVVGVQPFAEGGQRAPGARLEPAAASPWLLSVWHDEGESVLLLDWLALRSMAAVLAPEQP
ncbi:MAG TPA: chemotaxis protein CheW [Herpetosiphonaceae bacterium]